jgi:hypothetical protein
MLIVGDVHGKTNQFLDLVSEYRERSSELLIQENQLPVKASSFDSLIIQLGNLGFQKQWDEVINRTRFICLTELQTYEL